jgi:hypothetical protein
MTTEHRKETDECVLDVGWEGLTVVVEQRDVPWLHARPPADD